MLPSRCRLAPALLVVRFALEMAGLAFAQSPADADYDIAQREVRIPLSDGVHLWACLTHPTATGEGRTFPALLVMDPYAGGCSLTYYYEGPQARQGYVVAYVHVRGSGRSEGTFFDREYSQQELSDASEVIEWLARQPWSTGKVGMYGWSWSGFNTLQVAMRQPEALEAVIANVATENLYHEDVHYADGIFRFGPYNLFADLDLIHAPAPLDPTIPALLKKRFDRSPLSLRYLHEQKDGAFWRKRLRLDETPDTLQVPTYLLGGFYDGYRSALLRTVRKARAPTRAVIGPWEHSLSTPRPQADLAALMVRWWDRWLKNEATGVMDDPALAAYLRAPYQLRPMAASLIPGQWKGVEQWPPASREEETYYLSDSSLSARLPGTDTLRHRYVPTAGPSAGIWWGGVLPDQQAAEAHSLAFETPRFTTRRALLGRPEARLHVSAPVEHANWVVRLSDVAPDGTITRITGAAINGTHRSSSVDPSALVPGKRYTLTIPLHFTSWILEPGHRLRVSVSNGLWPMFWPTPYAMTTSLYIGRGHASSIALPFVSPDPAQQSAALARRLGSRNADRATYAAYRADSARTRAWNGPTEIIRNEQTGTTTVVYTREDSSNHRQTATDLRYTLSDEAPAEASVTGTRTLVLDRENGQFVWEGTTSISSDVKHFYYKHTRILRENGAVVRRKQWEDVVERRFQ